MNLTSNVKNGWQTNFLLANFPIFNMLLFLGVEVAAAALDAPGSGIFPTIVKMSLPTFPIDKNILLYIWLSRSTFHFRIVSIFVCVCVCACANENVTEEENHLDLHEKQKVKSTNSILVVFGV